MHKVTSQIENPEIVRRRHEQIYDAVVELFGKYGYQKTSMRDISKASGINLGYLYKYVSSKNDVLYIFYEGVSRLYVGLYEELAASTDEDPVEQLERFIADILKLIHANKVVLRAMLTESRHLEAEWLKAVLDKEAHIVRCVEKLLIRGMEKGRFEIQDSFMTANLIQYMVFIEPMRWWNLKKDYSFDDVIEGVTRFIKKALRAE